MADQEVPEEIQDYYQTEKRERAGVAWLLAFGTLVVTVLLAGGIFFGGRAAYRRFVDSDEKPSPEVAQNDQKEQEPATESANNQSPESEDEASSTDDQDQDSAVQGDESTNNTDTSTDPTPTPATGDIPDTGPGSTISIFFAVSILGYAIHRLYVKAS